MIHLTTTVSRKTPLDGRLEIPESLAYRLAELESPVHVAFAGEQATAHLENMACTCAKAGGNHHHHFLAAELLKSLPAGAQADLAIDVDSATIHIDAGV